MKSFYIFCGGLMGICVIGVITMSVLGARAHSLHLISLESGWTGGLWDWLWMALTASTFLLAGFLIGKVTTHKKDCEGK